MPMTKATVLATLPSSSNSFKIVNTTESVGAFVQDRRTGIMGRFDREPQMIPVTLHLHGVSPSQAVSLRSAEQREDHAGRDDGDRVQCPAGHERIRRRHDLSLARQHRRAGLSQAARAEHVCAGWTALRRRPTASRLSIGEHFSRIYENPYETPKIEGVELNFDLVPDRRSARLETARTDVTEARPGDRHHHRNSAASLSRRKHGAADSGKDSDLHSEGHAAHSDQRRRNARQDAPVSPPMSRRLDLGSTIALLNKEHTNSQLYVSLLEANPQAMVDDKVMPTLPLSVMNVMDGMRGTQDMVVVGESAINEASTPGGLRGFGRADHYR